MPLPINQLDAVQVTPTFEARLEESSQIMILKKKVGGAEGALALRF